MEYRLPDLGEGIDEAEIVRWLVKPGDRIARDQPVAQVQTDKAVVDLPAPAAGVIASLGAGEGERIHVGDLVVAIAEVDGTGAAADGGGVVQGIVGTIPGEEPIAAPGVGAAIGSSPSGRTRPAPPAGGGQGAPAPGAATVPAAGSATPGLGPAATPATRRLARELGVDLAGIAGTGPGGRITDADVRAASVPPGPAPATAPAPGLRPAGVAAARAGATPIRGLRRRIAERMEEAARIPRVTMMDEADATALVALRAQLRPAAGEAGLRLPYLPLVCMLAMAALRSHPALNAHYDAAAGEIRTFGGVDLGIATATGDGLLVPVVQGADRLGLLDLARALDERADGARARRLGVEDLRGSTFTVTSPGPAGGLFATPLLNPPEVAILAVGRIAERAVVRGGEVVAAPTLPFSLTFDHRAIDGADATAFAATFTALLANPARLLL